ncbi:MAG: NADAR family protein [Coriobacteriales bacterium]|nr:NADAR family protein [Coriobacteriales bacterium]
MMSENGNKAVTMWTMGFGDMNERLFGSDGPKRPEDRALRSDWKTLPMPLEHAHIELGIPVTREEFEALAMGHVPHVMEDHWFMYFDGDALCFHRSWTGICVYRVRVSHADDGYVLESVEANRDPGQYAETSDERDRVLATILLVEALGGDASALWDEFFAVGERGGADEGPRVLGFWNADDALGFCSNWHEVGLEFLGTRFPTAEHWIMWQKARVMGDWASADAILEAPSPKRAKELGRLVSPYDGPLWRDVREQLAYVGVREKFLQNPHIAEALIATGSAVLAEASPYDRVWGVGIGVDDEGFSDLTGWRGDNLQGRVCMRVRADLRLALRGGWSLQDLRTTKDDIEQVLGSPLGAMSLVELTRNPVTRPSAMCYARIAQRRSGGQFESVRQLLSSVGQTTIATIDEMVNADTGSLMPAGWYELLVQLSFLRRVGMA